MRSVTHALLFFVLIIAAAYGCGCATVALRFAQPTITNQAQYVTTYQVLVECLGNQRVAGTAVAVGPYHLITAKHVAIACERHDKITWRIRVKNGDTITAVRVAGLSMEHDAAVFRVMGKDRLPVWAQLSDRIPRQGERVCVLAGTPAIAGVRKCGEIFWVHPSTGHFRVSVHVVPGNSGGPVFDQYGQVIGIVSAGRWVVDDEFFGEMTIPVYWRDLWPK